MSGVQTRLETRPVLVTGGAGFVGANLADRLASEGRSVIVYDLLARPGVEANLAWLTERHGSRIQPVIADIRDGAELARAVREASAVFHFAAQVAVTTSLVAPREDMEVNLGGTLTLLEALRARGGAVPLLFASTNKVYGGLPDVALAQEGDAYAPMEPRLRAHGIGEDRPLDFHTPYGCSKGGADAYVLDYARSYGLPTVVMRMSCIYGPRQMGNEDQGWVAHFLIRALQGRPVTVYGDGRQVRDILHVSDAVAAYRAALARIDQVSGHAFNLGGGPENAVSLRRLLAHLGALIGREVAVEWGDWRPGDQRYYVSDTRRATGALGLAPPLSWREGVADLAVWLSEWLGQREEAIPARGRVQEAVL
ncbi:NAD-dependent epimerase/dehydratase family protein [Methylobacterium organophilum]|uniref:CDP-paratose 2-epimerase n=1 Tax=Methylobacterium organophilum TaxID=410 RepID=A0ABQ4T4J9_METOR|nr:NAD-dependent epimerase/dehydratase family protein [Methylobacterium organophilum]GJE25961.1 CDP-paratose 2-epimerase [Methylobacterium organophilum]